LERVRKKPVRFRIQTAGKAARRWGEEKKGKKGEGGHALTEREKEKKQPRRIRKRDR